GDAAPASPGERSAVLHQRLGMLVGGGHLPTLPAPRAVRAGSERTAQLWTRATAWFAVVLIGLTGFTVYTAPTRYEQPLSPAARVGGVPELGGPQPMTPQDVQLEASLRAEFANGPERLVPRVP
ncbi:MAG TPA: DNA-directed RNA polymerase sigma-70 factor, partial [Streptomyces sp.]